MLQTANEGTKGTPSPDLKYLLQQGRATIRQISTFKLPYLQSFVKQLMREGYSYSC